MIYKAILSDDKILEHHGILGQKWGVEHGPPYPLDRQSTSGRKTVKSTNKSKLASNSSTKYVAKENYKKADYNYTSKEKKQLDKTGYKSIKGDNDMQLYDEIDRYIVDAESDANDKYYKLDTHNKVVDVLSSSTIKDIDDTHKMIDKFNEEIVKKANNKTSSLNQEQIVQAAKTAKQNYDIYKDVQTNINAGKKYGLGTPNMTIDSRLKYATELAKNAGLLSAKLTSVVKKLSSSDSYLYLQQLENIGKNGEWGTKEFRNAVKNSAIEEIASYFK